MRRVGIPGLGFLLPISRVPVTLSCPSLIPSRDPLTPDTP